MTSLPTPVVATGQPPRLLDQLRASALQHGLTPQLAERYAAWARRYILFHHIRHPRDLGTAEVRRFLEHLARTETDPVSRTQDARDALCFLYERLLGQSLGELPLPPPPRLLDQLRHALRVRHYSPRTEECYVQWATRFILFHGKRHPREMGAPEITTFLTDLAVNGHVAAATQNQALNALVFLYTQVLGLEVGQLDAVRARRTRRLPVVLSPDEVRPVLDAVTGAGGAYRLMVGLLYGTGLRQEECCRLRVKDVDRDRQQIVVRQGKGDKDRVVMLPRSLRPALDRQFLWRQALQQLDLKRGVAHVALPDALDRKYPGAARELGWQFLFASRQLSSAPHTGEKGRHHLHPGRFSGPSPSPPAPPASTSMLLVIRSATASLPTSSNAASTFAPCNCCSATRASKRP